MLLVLRRILKFGAHDVAKLIVMQLALVLVTVVAAEAQEPPPPCTLDVPVYSPTGSQLPFRITRVTSANEKNRNLLSIISSEIQVSKDGTRISFQSNRIVGREIEVSLQGPQGSVETTRVIVTSCRMRRSIFHGQLATGADVSGIDVTGRLSGCKFDGDWWVRAVPMFGRNDGIHRSDPVDGHVDSDGTFWLVLGDYGVRHAMIIGKGQVPIKVVGFDVTAGRNTDLGSVDVKGLCP
jgi:hypothetical protein